MFAFSLRAAELEREQYSIDSFNEKSFKKLHYHLFQDIYSFAGQFLWKPSPLQTNIFRKQTW